MKSIISFLFLFITISVIKANNLNQRIKIVFRFDDYQLTSTKFYDSLFYIFQKNNIPLSLGIIPFDKNGIIHNEMNQEQLADLKLRIKSGEIEIALHGFNHSDNELCKGSFLTSPVKSEFAKLEYNNQFKRINKAKNSIDSLLNIKVNIFIPPFNSYDDNTLKVLDSLKFAIISSSMDGSASSDKIRYIPFTINDLNELPKVVKKYKYDKITIVVLLHPYSFKEGANYPNDFSKRIDFNQLDTLLNWIKKQNYAITTTFSNLDKSENYDKNRFVLNSTNNNLLVKILFKLKLYRYGVYNTAEHIRNNKNILTMFNVFLHIIVFLFIYFTAKIIAKLIKPSKKIMLIFVAIIVILMFCVLYKIINSHSLITYTVFIVTILMALFLGIKGNEISIKSRDQ
jgi:peptidoglycan/xylan/chitin deacetylase (PgdA/CDA1 family)